MLFLFGSKDGDANFSNNYAAICNERTSCVLWAELTGFVGVFTRRTHQETPNPWSRIAQNERKWPCVITGYLADAIYL